MNNGNGNGNGNGHARTNYRHPALAAITGGETAMKRTMRALRRRQWIFILVAGGIFTLSCLYAYSRPTWYRSEASVEVGPETPVSPTDLIGEGRTRSLPPWDHHFKTQEALLRREGLVKQVIETLPAGIVAPYIGTPDPVRALLRHMEVADIPGTFVIKVGLEHETAEGGREIVNRLIELYIEDSNKRLHAQILGVLEDLEKKTLPEMKKRVEDTEKDLQTFLAANGAGGITEHHAGLLAERSRLEARIFDLRMRASDLRWDPTRRDVTDEDPGSILGSPRLIDTLLSERGRLEMEIARQSAILKEGHPVMIGLHRQAEAINKRLKESLEIATSSRDRVTKSAAERLDNRLKEADEELKSHMTNRDSLNEAIAGASQKVAEYEKLRGEVEAARGIQRTYLTKQAEMKAMAGAGVSSVSVVDWAGTPVGTKKDTQLLMTLGAILGLLFGAAAVVIAEQNDDRASTPYEAEAAVGLDVLVSIPRLSKPLGSRSPVLPKDHPMKSPLEPFRRLRLEVAARLHEVEGSRVVAVAGAGFDEGKSTVAINLARVLGLEKRKVLLVDGEFRNPRLKALLADPKAPGIEDYLRTDAHFRDVVQSTKLPNVDVLGASKPMEEAPEINSIERFQDLWRKARSFYDYVIVDAGPVNAFSEAAGVATNADATVIVLDERRSKLRDVVSARRILENVGGKLLGMVVNRSLDPTAGGLVSRLIAEAHAKANGHAEAPAPVIAAAPALQPVIVAETSGLGEDPALKAVLDRLFIEMDSTKQRASALEVEKATLSTREADLRRTIEEVERGHQQKLEIELRKNAEWAEKFTTFVESSRSKEEEQLKKLEIIFTKSLEGVNKKLTDLRLRSFAGGGGGSGGMMEGDVQLRPSQATIEGIFSQNVESNLGAMDKPAAKKAAGGVNNALERLKNMRPPSPPPQKDEDKK